MTFQITKHKAILLLSFLIFSSSFAIGECSHKDENNRKELTTDGPYIFNLGDSVRIISVSKSGEISDRIFEKAAAPTNLVVNTAKGDHQFEVRLSPNPTPPTFSTLPDKIFALSDPHGDFESFIAILQAGQVINERYEWCYAKNHVVVIGDIFDRGVDVLPILWLCYKLEREAIYAGGNFHFIIGNHENMVLSGNLKYTDSKYTSLANALKMEYSHFFAPNTELGNWLRSKNYVEIIGNHLFVHAGISKSMVNKDTSLVAINAIMKRNLGIGKSKLKDSLEFFLFGNNGPIWYRGMVKDDEKFETFAQTVLQEILRRYKVNDIIVGHTIFDDIKSMHDGKIIPININNIRNRREGKGRAILLENKRIFVVNDKGELTPLL